MHISLDSALGSQHRPNSVGESVLQIAPNAKAAYSLRSLTGGDPKVVRVRRGSDNHEQDFTASEVSSGALVAFGNPTYTVGTSVESASRPFDSFTSNGNDGFTATNNTTGSATAGFPYTFATGDVISVSFDLVIANDATPTFILSASNLGSGSLAVGTTFTSSGSYTQEVTSGSGTGTHLAFTDGNTGTFTISNFKVTSHKADGFVDTWYDQSGNGKDAVQATSGSQPKIVNSGTLLNELDFDGTDDTLAIDFGANLSQANSLFIVHQSDTTTANINEFFDSAGGANPRTLLDQAGSDYRMFSTGASVGTGVAITTDKSLIFALFNGTSSLFAKNGTATSALNAGTTDINQNSTLGSSATRFYDGSMQEVIIYNSDQSSNRVALETNINSHYSIF